MTTRIAWLLIAGSPFVFGQGGQSASTIYQTLQTAGTSGGPFTARNSLGQAFHTFTFIYTNAPASTCTNPNNGPGAPTYQIYGSFDGGVSTVFLPIQQSSGPSALTRTITAYGAYPAVYARVIGFSANCRLSVYYAGYLYPTPIPVPDIYGLDPQGYNSAFFDSAAGSTQLELNPSALSISVLGVTLSNATAGQTASLVCGTGGGAVTLLKWYNLGAGQVLNLANTNKTYATCSSSLNLSLQALTAVAGTIYYRFN